MSNLNASSSMQPDFEYINVRPGSDHHDPTGFYEKWLDQSSAKHASPELIAADTLRRLYPGYSLVVSDDHRLTSLFSLPGISIHPSDSDGAEFKQISNVVFTPTPRRISGKVTGSLIDNVIFGSYRITWDASISKSSFVVHIAKFTNGNFIRIVHFILHDGPKQPARDLVLAVCLHTEQTHGEIWVFNQGTWFKNDALWLEIKDSSWDDVVMKEENKKTLRKDVYGFFKSEATYKKLSIPWKRGLIMYGPPGNGKTISIKVIMKTCTERGFAPLYVKSLQGLQSEEAVMQSIFLKARQLAPCVLILEDLDSLINNRNRSFFLNQLDGLEGNEGLLVIASTNHFDKLDPGLSHRPSRFDRKYLFDDPDYQDRALYAKYWKEKLKDNDELSFPDSLVEEVANVTQGFSFAYLKEAFVSALVRIADGDEEERVTFAVVLKDQIDALRRELGEETPACVVPHPPIPRAQPEMASDERISSVKQQSNTSREDKLVQRGHGSKALSGSPFPQGCVLHAPPSAYPQVSPGSLPSSNPGPLQDPIYPAWRGTPAVFSASTTSADVDPRNLFSGNGNSRLIKTDDGTHAKGSSASTNHDV